ncbi:MAG: gamma-glutamylputrescine oxidase [Bacteroidia bacterium]|jgi:gamma-glutamylputrescine oxidase
MNHSESHCPSYYAATRNDAAQYPPLVGSSTTDVCVIGAGFTGLSTALTLAERGYRVTVVEQHSVGWGASGRNGGQLIGGMTGAAALQKHWGERYSDALFELGYLGHKIIESRVERYGIDCDLTYGYMDVALKPRHLVQQQQWYDDWCSRGLEQYLELVPAAELPRVLGSSAYLGALVNKRNGHLHPLNLCLGEARAAAGLGVAIHEGSAVTRIAHGVKPVVHTTQGSVSADFVVLAGNAYHHLEQRKLGGRLFPASTYIIATEPLSEEEAQTLIPGNAAVCDQNEVEDYFRLSADRRLLFGGRCNYSGREPRNIEQVMLPRMRKIFPQLVGKRIDYAWGGKIGIVVNQVPILGRIGDNVFYAEGYCGHGVNMTHAFGEVLAEAIAGTSQRMDIFASMPHMKIPLGRALGGQAVGLGMLYYRLRDLF